MESDALSAGGRRSQEDCLNGAESNGGVISSDSERMETAAAVDELTGTFCENLSRIYGLLAARGCFSHAAQPFLSGG